MILSGEKKEEYRECKLYWQTRLVDRFEDVEPVFKQFDIIRMTNGYGKNAPTFDIECLGIQLVTTGVRQWGFRETCYALFLGNILTQTELKIKEI